MSEGGILDFFLLGSAAKDSPKKVQYMLSKVTGFMNLPPLFSLGYHFSKWDKNITAEYMMKLN